MKPDNETALIINSDTELANSISKILTAAKYIVATADSAAKAYGIIYSSPPGVILSSTNIPEWQALIKQIKADSIFRHIPLILISERNQLDEKLAALPLDDWLCNDEIEKQLIFRINFRKNHTERYLDANPLTRLPGNFSIISQLQERIDNKTPFGLGYVDIDNFKAFNDRYGFSRGDDIIRITARIITNILKEVNPSENFTGHVGGDDFVFICNPENLELLCKKILSSFDLVSANFANEEDSKRGFIRTEDRQGVIRDIPLPSLSIAAIDTRRTIINHPGEASSISGELKKAVKKKSGSNFMIDRRTNT